MSLQFSCGLGKKWLNAYVRHRSVAPNGSNHPPGRKTLRNDRPEHSIRCDQAEMFKNPSASKTFLARSSIRSASDLRSGMPFETFLSVRSEEHTSELQSLMRISSAVFCLKKKTTAYNHKHTTTKTHPPT